MPLSPTPTLDWRGLIADPFAGLQAATLGYGANAMQTNGVMTGSSGPGTLPGGQGTGTGTGGSGTTTGSNTTVLGGGVDMGLQWPDFQHTTAPNVTVDPIPASTPFNNWQTAGQMAQDQLAYLNPLLQSYAGMGAINQQLSGQLPADVEQYIGQMAAERGIATGTQGSDNNNAAYLRALGTNSLAMQQQGMENLNNAYRNFPQLDPTAQTRMRLQEYTARLSEDAANGRARMQSQTQLALENLKNWSEMTMQDQNNAFNWALERVRLDTQLTAQEREFAIRLIEAQMRASQQQGGGGGGGGSAGYGPGSGVGSITPNFGSGSGPRSQTSGQQPANVNQLSQDMQRQLQAMVDQYNRQRAGSQPQMTTQEMWNMLRQNGNPNTNASSGPTGINQASIDWMRNAGYNDYDIQNFANNYSSATQSSSYTPDYNAGSYTSYSPSPNWSGSSPNSLESWLNQVTGGYGGSGSSLSNLNMDWLSGAGLSGGSQGGMEIWDASQGRYVPLDSLSTGNVQGGGNSLNQYDYSYGGYDSSSDFPLWDYGSNYDYNYGTGTSTGSSGYDYGTADNFWNWEPYSSGSNSNYTTGGMTGWDYSDLFGGPSNYVMAPSYDYTGDYNYGSSGGYDTGGGWDYFDW